MSYRDVLSADYSYFGFNNPLYVNLNRSLLPKNIKSYSGLSINYFVWSSQYANPPTDLDLKQGLNLVIDVEPGILNEDGDETGVISVLNGTYIQDDSMFFPYDNVQQLISNAQDKAFQIMQNEVYAIQLPSSTTILKMTFQNSLTKQLFDFKSNQSILHKYFLDFTLYW